MARRQPNEIIVPSSKAAARERHRRSRDEVGSDIITSDAVERLRAALQPLNLNERRRAIAAVAHVFDDRALARAAASVED